MPPLAPLLPGEVALLCAHVPPHRAFASFLENVSRARVGREGQGNDAPWQRLTREMLAATNPDIVGFELGLPRQLLHWSPDAAAALHAALSSGWPTPDALRARVLDLTRAIAEIRQLEGEGVLSTAASRRLVFLLDHTRPNDPPAGPLAELFGDLPGVPIGLRAIRDQLPTRAPTAWRLAADELTRLLDRLDPA